MGGIQQAQNPVSVTRVKKPKCQVRQCATRVIPAKGGNPFITLEQYLSLGPRFRGYDVAARISSVSTGLTIFSHASSRDRNTSQSGDIEVVK